MEAVRDCLRDAALIDAADPDAPELLARRLGAVDASLRVLVVNGGVGGLCVVRPAALQRRLASEQWRFVDASPHLENPRWMRDDDAAALLADLRAFAALLAACPHPTTWREPWRVEWSGAHLSRWASLTALNGALLQYPVIYAYDTLSLAGYVAPNCLGSQMLRLFRLSVRGRPVIAFSIPESLLVDIPEPDEWATAALRSRIDATEPVAVHSQIFSRPRVVL